MIKKFTTVATGLSKYLGRIPVLPSHLFASNFTFFLSCDTNSAATPKQPLRDTILLSKKSKKRQLGFTGSNYTMYRLDLK